VTDQNAAAQCLADLQAMTSKARAEFLRHTGDPDGGNAYEEKFEELADALDALNLAAVSAAITALQGDLNEISDATKRLSEALDRIAAAASGFAEFSRIVDAGAGLVTALQGGNPQAIKDALDAIRTNFVGPAAHG
jgi:hypothetical protein